MNIKKYFLRSLLIALALSAGVGIVIFLIGEFGDVEVRLLITTLSIGGFSLTGLCSSTLLERPNFRNFSIVGMIVSVTSFALTILTIWELLNLDVVWKLMIISMIVTVALSHASLLLLLNPINKEVRRTREFTMLTIAIVGLMLINSTITEFSEGELYFRFLGVFAILNVLGTIATPILNKTTSNK